MILCPALSHWGMQWLVLGCAVFPTDSGCDFKFIKYSFSFIFRAIIDPIIISQPKVSLFQLSCLSFVACSSQSLHTYHPRPYENILRVVHCVPSIGTCALLCSAEVLVLSSLISNFVLRSLKKCAHWLITEFSLNTFGISLPLQEYIQHFLHGYGESWGEYCLVICVCWLLSVHRAALVSTGEPLLTQWLSLGGSYEVACVCLGRHNAQSVTERHRMRLF